MPLGFVHRPFEPTASMGSLLPDLQPVLLWLSNSAELLGFFHRTTTEYHKARMVTTSLATEDDTVVTLEDIVLYTFQQTVYYLTKVCCCLDRAHVY